MLRTQFYYRASIKLCAPCEQRNAALMQVQIFIARHYCQLPQDSDHLLTRSLCRRSSTSLHHKLQGICAHLPHCTGKEKKKERKNRASVITINTNLIVKMCSFHYNLPQSED